MRGHRYVGVWVARDFSRHFGGGAPSAPAPPPPPPPAPPDNTEAMQAAAAEKARQRNRRGRSTTILTSGVAPGDLATPPTAQPTLLGGGR